MKAWLLDALTGTQSLRLADVPDPVPAAGEAVVSVSVAGLNPADAYLAVGQYPFKADFPLVLGRDAVGVIDSVYSQSSDLVPGDRVLILRSDVGVNRPGTFAEKVSVPVESLAKVPPYWTDNEAAGAALVYLTAYQALSQWEGFLPAETDKRSAPIVLITGASGGVGVASLQLALAAGCRVIALSRSAGKREALLQMGAEFCFDPSDPRWCDTLKKSLGKSRVDLMIDNVGGTGFTQAISVLGHRGCVSIVGRLAGPVPEFNTASLLFRRIKIGGVAVGDYAAAESQSAWRQIVDTLSKRQLKPVIDSIYEFGDVVGAFEKLATGPMGKVLLQVNALPVKIG